MEWDHLMEVQFASEIERSSSSMCLQSSCDPDSRTSNSSEALQCSRTNRSSRLCNKRTEHPLKPADIQYLMGLEVGRVHWRTGGVFKRKSEIFRSQPNVTNGIVDNNGLPTHPAAICCYNSPNRSGKPIWEETPAQSSSKVGTYDKGRVAGKR